MITRELWLDSFNSWYWRSKGEEKCIECGYCIAYFWVNDDLLCCASDESIVCPLESDVCGASGSYFNKWCKHKNNNSRWAKYWAKKIFKAIAEHGKEYVTDRERGMIEEVLG